MKDGASALSFFEPADPPEEAGIASGAETAGGLLIPAASVLAWLPLAERDPGADEPSDVGGGLATGGKPFKSEIIFWRLVRASPGGECAMCCMVAASRAASMAVLDRWVLMWMDLGAPSLAGPEAVPRPPWAPPFAVWPLALAAGGGAGCAGGCGDVEPDRTPCEPCPCPCPCALVLPPPPRPLDRPAPSAGLFPSVSPPEMVVVAPDFLTLSAFACVLVDAEAEPEASECARDETELLLETLTE